MRLLWIKVMDASGRIGIAKMSKLLNGIYVTKDIVANHSTKLVNGHSGTKVGTALLPMRPPGEITDQCRGEKFLSDIGPFGAWKGFLRLNHILHRTPNSWRL